MKVKKLLLLMTVLSLFFASCSKDEYDESIRLDKDIYELYFEDNIQIEAKSSLDITYHSENEIIAKVSKDGIITGGIVGKTKIVLNNGNETKTIEVIINPRYNLYPNPMEKVVPGLTTEELMEIFGEESISSSSLRYLNYHPGAWLDVFLTVDKKNLQSLTVHVFDQTPDVVSEYLRERYILAYKKKYCDICLEEEAYKTEDNKYYIVFFPSNGSDQNTIGYGFTEGSGILW